jgi:hypothetical protein
MTSRTELKTDIRGQISSAVRQGSFAAQVLHNLCRNPEY